MLMCKGKTKRIGKRIFVIFGLKENEGKFILRNFWVVQHLKNVSFIAAHYVSDFSSNNSISVIL
jgi:hypothetical protein